MSYLIEDAVLWLSQLRLRIFVWFHENELQKNKTQHSSYSLGVLGRKVFRQESMGQDIDVE